MGQVISMQGVSPEDVAALKSGRPLAGGPVAPPPPVQVVLPPGVKAYLEVKKLHENLERHEKEVLDLIEDLSPLGLHNRPEFKAQVDVLDAYHDRIRAVRDRLVPLRITTLSQIAPHVAEELERVLDLVHAVVASDLVPERK